MWNRLVKQQAHLRIGAPWLPREPLSQPLWRQRGSPPESPQAMNFLQGSRRGSARVYLQCAQFSWNLDLWGIDRMACRLGNEEACLRRIVDYVMSYAEPHVEHEGVNQHAKEAGHGQV